MLEELDLVELGLGDEADVRFTGRERRVAGDETALPSHKLR